MAADVSHAERTANHTRYRPGQKSGHYESFFQRANHPSRPLAFWIRYTIFSPAGRPDDAVGELWAIYFDGESNRHVAVKEELPFERCRFDRTEFSAAVGDTVLGPGMLRGAAVLGDRRIAWDLSYRGESSPVFLFPAGLYDTALPKAKLLAGLPMAVYDGSLQVNDETVDITGWVGSQNHNWGSKHTDHYAWGQVAGFDDHPDSFLELATARLKIGPFWTPFMTLIVLRHDGEEIALNGLRQWFRAEGRFDYFTWSFSSECDGDRVDGKISAPREAFVGLAYDNPPGGTKHCLNSKIASCEITVTRPRRGAATLTTAHRAAFEILTDDRDHGVPISA